MVKPQYTWPGLGIVDKKLAWRGEAQTIACPSPRWSAERLVKEMLEECLAVKSRARS